MVADRLGRSSNQQ